MLLNFSEVSDETSLPLLLPDQGMQLERERERGGKRWWLRESDTPHKAGPSSHVKEFGIYLKEAGAAERTEAGAE